jgi:PAS domain S-box-containing protein
MSSLSTGNIESVLKEDRHFAPPRGFAARAHVKSLADYERLWQRARDDPEGFWGEQAESLTWVRRWDKVLVWDEPHAQWFAGGKMNASANCLDRHLAGPRANKAALLWEGEPGDSRVLTYRDLHREVCKFANALKKLGIRTGDRVTLYMAMVPELAIAMLACARIGAPHSVIFGGFSADAVADRNNDARARLVVTADGGWRRGKVVPLKQNVDAALAHSPTVEKCIVFNRCNQPVGMKPGRDLWWHELMAEALPDCPAEPLDSEHPLFLLYASGSTGKPKGVLHTTAGYLLGVSLTHRWVFDLREDDVYWCTADIGWVTGHSYQLEPGRSRPTTPSIVESSDDAILSKDLDGTIFSWNQGAERLYGYAAEEVIGKPVSLLIPADRPDELPGIMERLRRGERIGHFETVRVRKDGQQVQVAVSISPLKNAGGEVVGASAIARDLSERRRAEHLAEANRRKDEFLAMLAHELRNPLAPIPNAVQVLEDFSPADADLQWARDVIGRQVQHLTRLVDDLLDVSRINRGKIVLQKGRLKLAQVVADAVEIARPHVEGRKHRLTVSQPPEAVWLEGDSTRLAQVVANLLNNAAKYMERGGQIWLTVERAGEEAVVRVRDTGMGIAPERLSDIFGLFTQLDRSLDRSQGGLGIGLTLARRLVEMHGGTIHASSAGPGRGSEFVVRLPALVQVKEARESGGPSGPASAAPPPRRILIADDNEDFAEMTARLLQRRGGHEVKAVYDGPAALEAAQAFQPEVAFLDIGLPGVDGYRLAQQFRQRPGLEGALLVALTGYGQEEDRRRALAAGFDEHLTKPVRYDTLQRLLAERAVAAKV